MTSDDLTLAERHAEKASELPSLAFNLREMRRVVAQILTQFGRNNIFAEYTVHDFSHIVEMLKILDWLIPTDTRQLMSPGDWAMTVLSIYFHDLGLVVTEDEFQNRDQSAFSDFCDRELFAGKDGADYKAKVNRLPTENRDRFLYQEFVRANHAKRVDAWINGRPIFALGYANAAIKEIDGLLARVDPTFRHDLGLVCESHNLDDLEDIKKYKLSQPYGNTEDETVNLQYCAILLRSADLLQITQHRAPSVLYRLINPTDPISQVEWAKQAGVKRVRPKPAVDREGIVSPEAPSDTIEVFASFKNQDGFFGLTSYLRYAGEQLLRSHDVAEKAKRQSARKYTFPWRHIDDSKVEAEGFLKEPFGFQIDQARVLDLLTGHTLYNDSAVVLRELIQNAIDAVRLQCLMDGSNPRSTGRIAIHFDTAANELSDTDNGTGMSQEVIERHLLQVGSSRYQDQKFREKYPNFAPISRFGIGVLSSFMVADTVEITTCSLDDELGRQISLRSVHGKYLIQTIPKLGDHRLAALAPHGTRFLLKLRPSAKRLNVLETVRQWILFPRCVITVTIDGGDPQIVGFDSPKQALESYVATGFPDRPDRRIRVEERTRGGLTVAYALSYDRHFRDWSFVPVGQVPRSDVPVAIAIEGIAVEFGTPGCHDRPILAIADTTGINAPRTNVARSALERTAELSETLESIYNIYLQQISDEVVRLRSEEKYSPSWSVEQVPFIGNQLFQASFSDVRLFHAAVSGLPMYLAESEEKQESKSLIELIDA